MNFGTVFFNSLEIGNREMATRKETRPLPKATQNAPAGNTHSNERPVEPGLEGQAPGRAAHPPTRPPPPPAGTPGRGMPGRGRRNSDQPPPGSSSGGPTVPDTGMRHPEDLEDVTHAPHLDAADAGKRHVWLLSDWQYELHGPH